MIYTAMITEEAVKAQLKKVMDPELGISIVDVGLIYEVRVEKNKIHVLMTLTTPGCPLAPVIDRMVKESIGELSGVKEENVTTELTWDPPWTQDMMSEEARLELGF